MNVTPQNGQSGRKKYSLHSLLRAMADPASKDGGFEFETSQELARQLGRQPSGVYVPVSALTRDLTVGSPTGGGNTVATNLKADSFINMLRNRSICINAGATVLTGLVGNIAIPRQTSASTAYWVAEGNPPTESIAYFDQVPMSPKTLSAFCDVSRKMVLQSSLDISDFVRSDLAAAIGLGIDLAAINGSGSSNQPRGVLNADAIQVFDQAGTVPTWADLVQLETEVAHSNGDLQGARMA
jgi:HK97 family phage major capsid protein